jgi:rhodanese-related sulfurtransferase
MQKKNSIVIDIRTKEEWEKYWVIPWTKKYIVFGHPLFEYQIEQLKKDVHYLIYCWHGNRTKQTIEIMKNMWFVSVRDLAWWIDAWIVSWENIEEKPC